MALPPATASGASAAADAALESELSQLRAAILAGRGQCKRLRGQLNALERDMAAAGGCWLLCITFVALCCWLLWLRLWLWHCGRMVKLIETFARAGHGGGGCGTLLAGHCACCAVVPAYIAVGLCSHD